MILGVDIGNSYLKFKLWNEGKPCLRGELSHEMIDGLSVALEGKAPKRIVLANVSSSDIDERITNQFPGSEVIKIYSSQSLLGVTNVYENPEKLGVDRWLAMIEAFHDSGQMDCAVFDCGTACTLDVVNGNGLHLGGYIVPGVDLMRGSLLSGTKNVKVETSHDMKLVYGRNTQAAVENGILSMLVAWIDYQIKIFRSNYPKGKVYITGGASVLLQPYIEGDCVTYYQDLVLDALKRISLN